MSDTPKEMIYWMDGKFVPESQATVPFKNHGLHYASVVFEGERAYDGKIFKSREHSERLHKSAEALGITIPYSIDELEKAKAELLKRNGITGKGDDYYVRVAAYRGGPKMGVDGGDDILVGISLWRWDSMFDQKIKEKGIRLAEARFKRPSKETAPVHSKASGLYMICTIGKKEAKKQGYDDALMLDYRGHLAEATGANMFLVMKNGEIHTPTPDCFLNGITRQTVIKLAQDRQLKVVERHIDPRELADAKEVFLTGSAAEVTPVGEITMADGKNYKFQVGEKTITNRLAEDYQNLVRAHARGMPGGVTPARASGHSR